jgi:uncharacterized protein YacL
MGYPAKEMWRIFLSVVVGAITALLIIFIFQILSPHVFPPLEEHNPKAFWELTEKYKPIQIKNEILGLFFGSFIGALLTALLCKTRSKTYTLLTPVLFVLLITIMLWPFTLLKELIWLALPVWITIALGAYYIGQLIKKRIWKLKDQVSK